MEDMRSVWSPGSWILKPGTLMLSSSTKGFNPKSLNQTNSQCWIRITSVLEI
jgi:hypothetical protein